MKDTIKIEEKMPDGYSKITWYGEGFIFGMGKAKHFKRKVITIFKEDISAQELLDICDEDDIN